MNNYRKAIIGFSIILQAVACSSNMEEFSPVDEVRVPHTAILHLEGSIERFDAPATRATTADWDDGATVYIQYQTNNGSVDGTAVYNQEKDEWTVNYYGTITEGENAKCEVYYFENPSSVNTTTVTLNQHSVIYADSQASYIFEDNTITLRSHFKLQTGRIRFHGTAGCQFMLTGLQWYSSYDIISNKLSQKADTLALTVDNDGYTPYIYASFANLSERQLIVNCEGNIFSKDVSTGVLSVGKSGYIDVPTAESYSGWTFTNKEKDPLGLCPDRNHPHMIDLGLGVKWACCNVGNVSNETPQLDTGDFFAWGETEQKPIYNFHYTWGHYKWCNESETLLTKYCGNSAYGKVDNNIQLEPSDDVAFISWGKNWRMPTWNEFNDLKTHCSWDWTTINGINGYKVTGSNGNIIFLRAGGAYSDKRNNTNLISGAYWTSEVNLSYPQYARQLHFDKNGIYIDDCWRCTGLNIRPVYGTSDETQSFTIMNNGKTVSFKMKLVKAGTFQMGSTSGNEDEKPIHSVTLTKDYYMGETEVTQALWYAVMGQSPTSDDRQWESKFGLGEYYPSYQISYEDCQHFLTKLNQLTGQQFRFPTEAEWEYAARGGQKSQSYTYAGSNTIGDVAWYAENSSYLGISSPDYGTHIVATKMANELGLYDMSGNVWEWCADWDGSYSSGSQTNPTGPNSGTNRVFRGGGWTNVATCSRVAFRGRYGPTYRDCNLGLRLAL